jgi:D-alanyl-D-alanine-carboxypeptidase/D-alanyl-D-alanine-endopeptidase
VKNNKHVLFACISIMAAFAAQASPQLDENLRASLRSRIDSGELVSVVIGVLDGADSAVYGFGKAGAPGPDGQTVYEIGSITKTFTGLLLAQAVKSGAARLDQPVAQLLPGYAVPAYKGQPITLLDLATQTSGLPRMPDNMRPVRMDNPYADYTAEGLKTFLAGHQLARQPGSVYEYSNLGVGLLGQALSEQAKKPYGDLIRDRIAIPLGMESTAVALSPSMRARLAPGHDAEGRAVANWDMDALAGAGAVRSDAHDMIRYLQAMMSAGPDTAYALAREPQRPFNQQGGRIALAWHTNLVRNTPVIWHNGMTGGYASFAGFTADGQRGVVVLTNSAVSVDNIALAALVPGAKPEPKQVVLAPEVLAGYAGRYQLAPGFILTVRPSPRGLLIQATGQGVLPAFASARDEFFVRAIDAPLIFKRDASGAVESLVLHQNGRDSPGKKLAAEAHAAIHLDSSTLDQYRGSYRLEAGMGIPVAVTVESGRLYGQAAGQERFLLSAMAVDEFFYDPDGIQVSFKRDAAGKVRQLMLRQDGHDIKGELQPPK